MVSAWFSGLMPAACGRAAGGQSGLLVDTVGDERSRTDRDLSSASAAPMSKFGASGSIEPAAATAAPSSWPLLWWASTSMHITHHPSSVTRILLEELFNLLCRACAGGTLRAARLRRYRGAASTLAACRARLRQ